MTFDKLYDLLEEGLIENRKDKLITEKILEAERDWINPISELEEFIETLEKEIEGETSKENLKKLLERYSPNGLVTSAWKSESVTSLIEIFEFTGFSNLRKVFGDLSDRLNSKAQLPKSFVFEEKGYPTIKIHNNDFEIKAIDFSKFRKFKYSDLKEVKLIDYKEKWWFKLYSLTSFSAQIFSEDDPIKLKIFKKNGANWEYKASNKYDEKFYEIIEEINNKIINTIVNTI